MNQAYSQHSTFLTVAYGDGVGPEIMEAVLFLLKEARVGAFIETIQAEERFYENGMPHGISPDAFARLTRTGVLLKAPHIMPVDEKHESPQDKLDERFQVLAHVMPLRSFSPVIPTAYPERNSLLIQGQKACELNQMLLRAAAQIAQRHGLSELIWYSDGEQPGWWDEIQSAFAACSLQHRQVETLSAADITRHHSQAIVTRMDLDVTNLTSNIAGSPWLSCRARIAPDFALFEPMHEAMPELKGKQAANPAGLIRAACLMLLHMGRSEEAALIENALLRALEDRRELGTMAFAELVADYLGDQPRILPICLYPH